MEVILHSTAPEAVAATRQTIEGLPCAEGALREEEGRFYVPRGFTAWACERQGYVREVKHSFADIVGGIESKTDDVLRVAAAYEREREEQRHRETEETKAEGRQAVRDAWKP